MEAVTTEASCMKVSQELFVFLTTHKPENIWKLILDIFPLTHFPNSSSRVLMPHDG